MELNSIFYLHPLKFMKSFSFFLLSVWKWWVFVIPSCYAGDPGGDYINANFIDGYRRQGAYIATQGPMPDTFCDFWRMVWEQHTANIIMITKLEEKSRVRALNQRYRPHSSHVQSYISRQKHSQPLFQNLVSILAFCYRQWHDWSLMYNACTLLVILIVSYYLHQEWKQ